jgi:hypothetical protein
MEKVVDVGAVTVSNVYAVYFTVPVAIASMVQLVPTVELAVYRPLELMVPHFAVHETGMFAVNCWVFPCGVLADDGVMVMAEITVTLAVTLPLPFVAFAVTVHVVEGYSGALNRPEDEMEPQFVDHVDAVLAVNCWVAFSFTVAEVGESVTPKAGTARLKSSAKTETRMGKNITGISKAIGILIKSSTL